MTKTYGIMFKPEMIRAYFSGVKNQTRRMQGLKEINEDPGKWELIFTPVEAGFCSFGRIGTYEVKHVRLPYGNTDCTLWFKETWKMFEDPHTGQDFLHYRADDAKVDPDWWSKEEWTRPDPVWAGRFEKWQSSMLMPQICSRYRDVPIRQVRVERLLDITGADCFHEGVGEPWNKDISGFPQWHQKQRKLYFDLWDSINGKTLPAVKNPWVFVYVFENTQLRKAQ